VTNSTLSSNMAGGGSGSVKGPAGSAWGGGLYVAGGTVTLTGDTLSSNSAVGGRGGTGFLTREKLGGYAHGGGLCVAGGTVTMTSSTLSSNSAVGGPSYAGGSTNPGLAYGGDSGREMAQSPSAPTP
jgi:hypothetical protein